MDFVPAISIALSIILFSWALGDDTMNFLIVIAIPLFLALVFSAFET